MSPSKSSVLVLLTLSLGACAVFEPQPTVQDAAVQQAVQEANQVIAREAQVESELESQLAEQERLLAEDRARAAAAAEAARREAEEREARARAERQAQAAAERRPAAPTGPSVEERAQAVALQQERIAELRARISANQVETTNLEAANATLVEAVAAAEELIATLTEEQDKYTNTNSATGATVQALSKERIAELNAELERLQAQAAALSRQQP